MTETNLTRRALYVLTVWVEPACGSSATWRGSLETANGQRAYFNTLADLNRLLSHKSGWVDPALGSTQLPVSGGSLLEAAPSSSGLPEKEK